MKYLIDLWIDETLWDGRYFEEGENPLYDEFNNWMNNGKDGEKVFSKVDGYMKLWNKEAYADGGSLYRPNGIDWFAHIEVHPNMIDFVKEELNDFCKSMKKDKDFNSCPIELEIDFRVEEE